MEKCIAETAEGRARKERESARKEEELTEALRAEDARIQKEQEVTQAAQARTEDKTEDDVEDDENMSNAESLLDGPMM